MLDAEILDMKCYRSRIVEDVKVTIEGKYHLRLLHKQAYREKDYCGTLLNACNSSRNRHHLCFGIKDCLVKCNDGHVFPS